MKTRNRLPTLLILSSRAAAATALINKAIKLSATSRDVLGEPEALCYKWCLGNIHYAKIGTGKPILLVHDLTPTSSGHEWKSLAGKLAETYTVHAIDLLGSRRSEKPNPTYTNYLYVQLLSDFIRSEIGHGTDIVASDPSIALGIIARNNSPELFNQLLFINPESLLPCSQMPGKDTKLYKVVLNLPIVGTLIYNIACSKQFITKGFLTNYCYNPYSVKIRVIDAYHKPTHLSESPKSAYTSLRCNYVKCNTTAALKKIGNSVYLLGGDAIDDISECMEEYREYDPVVEWAVVPNTKSLPHLEKFTEVFDAIQTYLP